jgi:hypothetical protein
MVDQAEFDEWKELNFLAFTSVFDEFKHFITI